MIYLKADTNQEVLIGPAVAVGDGFVPVTNLHGGSSNLADVDEAELIKYGGSTPLTVTDISTNAMTPITGADGYYTLDLSTGNLDTEGFLVILINDDSLILPIRLEFMVVNANVYDSMFAAAATDFLQVDVVEQVGTTVPAPNNNGIPDVNVREWLDVAVTLSTGNKPDVNVDEWADVLLGTTNPLPNAVPGAAGGVFIAGANVATSIATTGLTATLTGSLTGSVASVSGAVGSVTGNVDGDVSGSVANVLAIATDAVDADSLNANAVVEIRDAITGGAYALNTTALGNIGIDWANVENPGSTVDLAATDIQLADTTTVVTDDVGITATAVDLIYDEAMVETTGAPAITGSFREVYQYWAALSINEIHQTATLTTLRNNADSGDLSTSVVSDDSGTFIREKFSA